MRCAHFCEAGERLIFPLPPDRKDVTVVDMFSDRTAEPLVAALRLDLSGRAGSRLSNEAFTPQRELDDTVSESSPATILRACVPPQEAAAPSEMLTQHSNTMLHSCSTDMVHALQHRLYPHRRLIVWVCMPQVMCEDLVDSLDAEIVPFRSPTEAQTFIRANILNIIAVVTSSLRNEFEIEGICGPDICALVTSLRTTVELPEGASPGERCWPLALLVTKTLPMGDCVESCDIFVHSLKSADTICMTEISRRLAPPSVVCVHVTLSDDFHRFIEKELSFSIHHFDTTFRAYQFVLACPWNVAAIITDRCLHLQREGHITASSLGVE